MHTKLLQIFSTYLLSINIAGSDKNTNYASTQKRLG
ncbi:unnamed protein product [Amoebophrya sp. A120]|nr:unnamed protein product [Amoebophrya sp. A120]|eukprot:GSA120T00016008001.1